jgi:hypothetical protein
MKLSVTIFILFLYIPMAFSSTDPKNKLLYNCFEATNDAVKQSSDPFYPRAESSGVALLDYTQNKDKVPVEEALILFNSKIYRGVIDSKVMHLDGIDTEGSKVYRVYEGWYVFEIDKNTYHLVLKKWVSHGLTQKITTEIIGAEENLTPNLNMNESETPEEDSLIFRENARTRVKDLQKAYQDTLNTQNIFTGITDIVVSKKGKEDRKSLKNLTITLPGFDLVSSAEARKSALKCLELNDNSMNGILQKIILSAKANN